MNKMSYAASVILSLMIIGCGASNSGALAARSAQRREAQQDERAAILQRLIPEEGSLPANRLRDVLAAIATIDKGFELENPTRERVRRHLIDRELTTLRRIEANVRAIERKRRDAGLD